MTNVRLQSRWVAVALMPALLGVASCAEPSQPPPGGEIESEALSTVNGFKVNGFKVNGFKVNGFKVNGFKVNGFKVNGFKVNGLSTNGWAEWEAWFNGASSADADLSASFMKYFIGCAMGAGEVYNYTDKYGRTHTWEGALGLAPGWAEGVNITAEQNQLVTACMAAHVNTALPEPKHIQISLRGAHPNLAVVPTEGSALGTYDGTFFGDVFSESSGKLYLCKPSGAMMPSGYVQTLLRDWGRDCYFSADGCGGLFTLVDCGPAVCQTPIRTVDGPQLGPTCTVDGVTYQAIDAFVPQAYSTSMVSKTGLTTDLSCVNCFERRSMTRWSVGTSATRSGFVGAAGNYVVDIRYANPRSTTGYLTVKVKNPTTGAVTTVMNGTSNKWSFAPTGGADVWKFRSIPVSFPANGELQIHGAGTPDLKIDAIIKRLP